MGFDPVTLGAAKADARRGYGKRNQVAPVVYSARRDDANREYPVWEKVTVDAPTVAFAGQSLPSMSWPNLIPLPESLWAMYGGDRWALVYATDHESNKNNAGVALLTAPDPITGPWHDRGKVYNDVAGQGQCETSWVCWNPVTGLFHLYYSLKAVGNGVQSSLVATSPDLTTWTKIGITIDVPAGNLVPGDGHTGYSRVFRLGDGTWVCLSLAGGSGGGRVLSYSRDGITWVTDWRRLKLTGWWADARGNSSDVFDGVHFQWRNQRWFTGRCGPANSGGTPADNRMIVAPVSEDWRRFTAAPVDVTPAITWEGSEMGYIMSIAPYGDTLLGVYRGAGEQGGFGLMRLVV